MIKKIKNMSVSERESAYRITNGKDFYTVDFFYNQPRMTKNNSDNVIAVFNSKDDFKDFFNMITEDAL